MAETYYIYEIPKVKIGCTDCLTRRQRQQLDKGELTILEEHIDINLADRRERELQAEKGYPVEDKGYIWMRNWVRRRTEESYKKISKARKGIEPEQFKENGQNNVPVKAIKNNKVTIYPSQTIAAVAIKGTQVGIAHVLRGLQKRHRGYYFEYA